MNPPSPRERELTSRFFVCGFGSFFAKRGADGFGQMRNRAFPFGRRRRFFNILFRGDALFFEVITISPSHKN
jgi:hypothetical protein